MTTPKRCAVCEDDVTTYPALVLARWRNQDICTDCLTNAPGKEDAEAEAQSERPLMSQEDYRTNDRSEGCPRCWSTDYTPGHVIVAGGCQLESDRWCHVCGLGWTAIYRIAGYLRHGHETDDMDALQDVWCVDLSRGSAPTACVVGLCVKDATCPRELHCRRHACDCPEDEEERSCVVGEERV
jgi:hypothetical protein